MRHLFNRWGYITLRVKRSRSACVLSDYDGTLTPIAPRPELALLSDEMRDLLRRLADNPRYIVAVISGRPIEEVKALVDVQGIFYAGNHGLEIEGPNCRFRHPGAGEALPNMMRISAELKQKLQGLKGVIVEDKGLTASIHYRLAPPREILKVREILEEVAGHLDGIMVTQGKRVFEVRPNLDWNKGSAAKWIVESLAEDALPIYIGDDRTDEDAFTILKRGITVCVTSRPRRSNAKYYLKNVYEVQEFIRRLISIK
ncbi:MAG: trehalose-phosphatase [Candidatus Bathyarchaeia archaeon]